MSRRVVLHVGAMKTGTSYLQALLAGNADGLAREGVLVMAKRGNAVHDLTGRGRARFAGAWDRLARQVLEADEPTAVVSHEFLGLQGPAVARRALASFGGAELDVVVTVRDAAAVLPAQWQSAARNKGNLTWSEYAEAARDEHPQVEGHTFRHAQRIGRVLRVWGDGPEPARLHVVTTPRPGSSPDLLWQRFAAVLGVDPASAPERDVRTNPSAGYASAHLLCLLHRAGRTSPVPVSERRRALVFLAEGAASTKRRDRPPLDAATLDFAAAWNRRVQDVVTRRGTPVTGSWEDLPVVADQAAARPLADPPDDAVLLAAADAVATLRRIDESATDPGWSSVDDAVPGLLDLVEHAWRTGALERLGRRGRDLRER